MAKVSKAVSSNGKKIKQTGEETVVETEVEEKAESTAAESNEAEHKDELQEIEDRLEKGEELTGTVSETSMLLKSRVLFSCVGCSRIHFRNKWIPDNVTDIYTIRTELTFCNDCLSNGHHNFIGVIEIYDRDVKKNESEIIKLAKEVQYSLENRQKFEKIIRTSVNNDILFVFTNTTRLAMEIARTVRKERSGMMQYEWFKRNQFLRAKWYASAEDRAHFKERVAASREMGFGMFSFEL